MNDGTPAPRLSTFAEPTNVTEWDALHERTRRIRAGQQVHTLTEFGAMLTMNDLTSLMDSDTARDLRGFSDYDDDDLRQELYLCGLDQRDSYDAVRSIASWLESVGLTHLRHKLLARQRLQVGDAALDDVAADWRSRESSAPKMST